MFESRNEKNTFEHVLFKWLTALIFRNGVAFLIKYPKNDFSLNIISNNEILMFWVMVLKKNRKKGDGISFKVITVQKRENHIQEMLGDLFHLSV